MTQRVHVLWLEYNGWRSLGGVFSSAEKANKVATEWYLNVLADDKKYNRSSDPHMLVSTVWIDEPTC